MLESKTIVFGLEFLNTNISYLTTQILLGYYNKKMIVTPNVDHVVRVHKDQVFKSLYLSSDLIINDSRILKLLSSITGKKIQSLIPGSDLTAYIFEKISNEKCNVRIAVIGADDSVISKLKTIYDIEEIFHYNPPMGFDSNEDEIDKCVNLCRDANADLIFLAVGSPKQEMLASRLRKLNVNGCYLCIGASLLFLSGAEKRAPKLLQKLHLEWFFRLIQNPSRLAKRYLFDGLFIIPIFFREFLK